MRGGGLNVEIRRLVMDFFFCQARTFVFYFFRGCLTLRGWLSGIEAVVVVEDVSIPSDFFLSDFFYHFL